MVYLRYTKENKKEPLAQFNGRRKFFMSTLYHKGYNVSTPNLDNYY